MSVWEALFGALVGFVAGVLSGLFGVGGGIVTTPAIQYLLGATPIQAVATPLPVIFPTSLVGAYTYAQAGEVSSRAVAWGVGPGIAGAVLGAALTQVVNAHLLLFLTALLLGWTALQVVRGRQVTIRARGSTPGWQYAAVGFIAGFVSGLLGLGGGIVIVPALTAFLGMPLRRALGTSLVLISAVVVPGTLVHWALGHIDWAIFLVVSIGAVPGARLGARIALAAQIQTLRVAVGGFLLTVAALYGASELTSLLRARG